ncbi:ATP-grasp domain-containing protein [Phycicoccus endophyticus]|uniref:biotin carboxylase n=1 Tax=Phycicoccus endophyticus TaxID=1690220 RepID=A0A7G9QZC0_9MICO|nr:carboxyl transferase domain-containing protein [Phycicoccus endophyticus]NHI19049.1 ATP-grasp domain-containing protein [Phycicoccus endophyticus]QNN48695.1 ATP-grasp domain-containing protein [Phycicoccus endophyticus]GGL32482.1 fused acetyl/propionyl-CoA carboxylase subuit alpha/methylmalonyl-CoA decarboxylase subunit alpha [Phycicoccus endophyticus]
MFSRIAVVNRGEAAMRLVHAVRDLNAELGPGEPRTEVVALHTEEERTAMFVREADIAYDLGPASARPYLDHDRLATALRETAADAVWVGWGFVAEDPAFAQRCGDLGVTFIGPSPQAMRRLGDKIGSKLIAEEVGVPVAPWSKGGVDTLEEATAAAAGIGYPLMLKATAGGGGRGIRKVGSDAELAQAYQRTREEAERAFGSGVVFLEKLVTGARHVEVQVIADGQGTAWAIGVRDCSVQRRNQKVIEESASPLLDAQQVGELKAAAERLAVAVGYAGAGTVEFLYHPGERFFAFLEVNTRLQVEHPITEVVTRTDLVRLQIHVAAGGRLEGERPDELGHAVEARLNAEDPDRDFAPAPGRIAHLELPAGPGVRVDTGVAEGDTIPADFDSMIAKVIAFGHDRDEALARLRRAMRETTVVIEGGATNKSFVLELLDQPEVLDGSADTGWIDRVRAEGRLVATEHSGVALVAAGIESYLEAETIERARLLETARGGRPQVQHTVGRAVDLTLRGTAYRVTVLRTGPARFRVTVVDPAGPVHAVEAELERTGQYASRLRVGGRSHRLVTAAHGPVQLVEVDGVAHRVSRDEGGVLRSPAPALVVATPVPVGSEVAAGAPVLVLESMKMETVLPAPFAAVVKELLVATGSQVETGAPLVRLEPTGETADAATEVAEPVELDLPETSTDGDARVRAARARADLSAMLLGYDVDPSHEGRALEAYLGAREELVGAGTGVVCDEIDLLTVFADLAELARNRPVGEETHVENRVHSPREHFRTFLQTLDTERGGLPADFVTRLQRVLRHYGVEDVERSPQLEGAVFRVFLSQQRSAPEVTMATSILQRWLAEPAPGEQAESAARDLLDRLVVATQLRFPIVGDLARSVRFRWFDQPLVDADRRSVLGAVGDELERIDALPPGQERTARVDELAAIPERIVRFLGERLRRGVRSREPMLEVLVKRHYRGFGLAGLEERTEDERAVAVADYRLDERDSHLVSTIGRVDELAPASALTALVGRLVADRAAGQQAVVDLYLHWPDLPSDPDEASSALRERVASLPFVRECRRVAVGVVPDDEREVGYFTYRPLQDGSVVEDTAVRGVHPMVGRRLNLWRLRDFTLTRLEAPEDVLLLHAVSRDNPRDQRLVATAQVRQLVVVRDEEGRVTALPHVERALANCLEAVRRARGALGGDARLDMNHVWLHIWPAIEADLDQLTALQGKVAPITAGAGIDEVRIEGEIAGEHGHTVPICARFTYQPGSGVTFTVEQPPTERLAPLDSYAEKVVRARRRGLVYPYELVSMVAGAEGEAHEYDLDDAGRLVPVERPYGENTAGMICGVVTTPTPLHPEGVTRVLLCGDPLRALGAVAEPECRRVIAALDLAEERGLPVEWFALSAGARISMDSGTENMDWVARALKRIVEFTQAGGEINVVVAGINVGAQPYWNAEATMLMHTRGILVMTPDSAMVLTGKQSLDFSGGVSAEDNFGIGGYDRVMGPNGQAQYWAKDLADAYGILLAHYESTWVAPGEAGPRRAATSDPVDRDVTTFPHALEGSDFTTVGDIFSARTNPDRKKAFDIRTVMRAVADQDHATLERWAGMADAETAVVYDARVGGIPVALLGIESRSIPRRGFPPTDGPDTYTAGTLFPRSSKKVARAINAASGNRPLVVLANLSGFDGSPESMRGLQLEYGAEIGRAVVNFEGPIVFVVVSRYHGGAFVVFSKALNPRMTVLAVEGSYASVIGGAPAAAVVFAREVDARTAADPRVAELADRLREADPAHRPVLATELESVRQSVRAEMLGAVAAEFDRVHDIHRAVDVGSVDAVIAPEELRPRIVAALSGATG